MARDKTVYTCTACGGTNPKWLGKCPHCGEWNTLEEGVAEAPSAPRHRFKAMAPMQPVATLSEIEAAEIERTPTGLAELDRPLGGGIVGLGLLVTTTVQNQAKAVMVVLLLWLASAALLDFALVGSMLEWRLPARLVFALAAVNPVEAARLALLTAVDPELSVLGPVGFYLANRLGSSALFALGIVWPLFVGLASFAFAARWFRRGDVV